MWYRFERDYVSTAECIVEADSLEAAKQKAEEDDDLWSEKDEVTEDDAYEVESDFWDELPEDKDFFNHFK